jgi:phosphate:Na+ symporter
VQFVIYISANASIERTLANAHMLFNIFGVLIFVWTIPLFEKLLNKMLPDKTEEQLAREKMEKIQKISRKNKLP